MAIVATDITQAQKDLPALAMEVANGRFVRVKNGDQNMIMVDETTLQNICKDYNLPAEFMHVFMEKSTSAPEMDETAYLMSCSETMAHIRKSRLEAKQGKVHKFTDHL